MLLLFPIVTIHLLPNCSEFSLFHAIFPDSLCGTEGLICMNGGSCPPDDDESAMCICPTEYTGEQCESKANCFTHALWF